MPPTDSAGPGTLHLRLRKGGSLCGARGKGTESVRVTALEYYAAHAGRCAACWRLLIARIDAL